jgi:hypothetical protein
LNLLFLFPHKTHCAVPLPSPFGWERGERKGEEWEGEAHRQFYRHKEKEKKQ